MSGEQHVNEEDLQDVVHDMLDSINLEPDDYDRCSDSMGDVLRPWLEARLAEVRALPDRETIARAMHDAATAKARAERANVARWEEISAFHRNGYLAAADAVLALLGQEGQR